MSEWFPTLRRLTRTLVPLPSWWPGRTTSLQRQSLLRLIAVAAEEHLPLGPLVEAWAEDDDGIQRHRLHRLAHLLKIGTPLADAVEAVPGVLRDEDVLAIRFGAQSGTLPAAVRGLLDESTPTSADIATRIREQMVYVWTLVVVAALIVTFVQLKIAPEFQKIWQEFSLESLPVMQWSHYLTNLVTDYWYVGALVVFVLLWLTYSAWPGRTVRRTFLSRFARAPRELRSADLLQHLSIALQAGRPVSGALSSLARYHFDPVMRHKLLFIRNEVEQGTDVWQSMATAGLLTTPEMRLLTTADRVGNQPWVLKHLAQGKKRRTMQRLEKMAELVTPTLVVAMGAFVLFQALTIFLPLIRLISGLA